MTPSLAASPLRNLRMSLPSKGWAYTLPRVFLTQVREPLKLTHDPLTQLAIRLTQLAI